MKKHETNKLGDCIKCGMLAVFDELAECPSLDAVLEFTAVEEMQAIDALLEAGEATPEQEARGLELVGLFNAAGELRDACEAAEDFINSIENFNDEAAETLETVRAALAAIRGTHAKK